MEKTNIIFFIHQLNSGGAQKVILNLVKNIDKTKFDVTLAVVNNIGEFSNFSDPNVNIIDFKSKSMRRAIPQIIKLINTKKPDIVFSGLAYLSLIFALIIPFLKIKNKIKFIARESSIPSISNAMQKNTFLLNTLYRLFYKNFDLIICQSEYMKNDLAANYKISEYKMTVINNPVDIDNILLNSDEVVQNIDINKINLLAVGRLHKVKGFDLAIKAVAKLDDRYHLNIIGEGKERKNLQNLIKELKIENRVSFLGYQDNPFKYMKECDLFILSSRHEGFPNAVLEANTCGLPAIAFKAPGGTVEIINENINGILVEAENIEKLKESIILGSNKKWDKTQIKEYIYNEYNLKYIISKYEERLCN